MTYNEAISNIKENLAIKAIYEVKDILMDIPTHELTFNTECLPQFLVEGTDLKKHLASRAFLNENVPTISMYNIDDMEIPMCKISIDTIFTIADKVREVYSYNEKKKNEYNKFIVAEMKSRECSEVKLSYYGKSLKVSLDACDIDVIGVREDCGVIYIIDGEGDEYPLSVFGKDDANKILNKVDSILNTSYTIRKKDLDWLTEETIARDTINLSEKYFLLGCGCEIDYLYVEDGLVYIYLIDGDTISPMEMTNKEFDALIEAVKDEINTEGDTTDGQSVWLLTNSNYRRGYDFGDDELVKCFINKEDALKEFKKQVRIYKNTFSSRECDIDETDNYFYITPTGKHNSGLYVELRLLEKRIQYPCTIKKN